MKFVSYRMNVKYEPRRLTGTCFGDHMTANFAAYCREFPVFQELVRMHKLVQVAKWYRACGFPDDKLLAHERLRIPTLRHTRRMTSPIGVSPPQFRAVIRCTKAPWLAEWTFRPKTFISLRPRSTCQGRSRSPRRGLRQYQAAAIQPPRFGSFYGPARSRVFCCPDCPVRPHADHDVMVGSHRRPDPESGRRSRCLSEGRTRLVSAGALMPATT